MKKRNVKFHARVRAVAYVIHDKLHLTFGQCVQMLLTNHGSAHLIANRNINKENVYRLSLNADAHILSLFDAESFNNLLKAQIEFCDGMKI